MISIFHYINAKRRLKQSQTTIEMMGGRQNCASMVLAQHEMIHYEVEYYREKMAKFLVWGFISLVIGVILVTCYKVVFKP
jgi:hypothetical protein